MAHYFITFYSPITLKLHNDFIYCIPSLRKVARIRFEKLRLVFWHCHTASHSTTPHPMIRASRWYTVGTLLYDLC